MQILLILLKVHPNIGNTLGEKVFIGVLTGAVISLFLYLWNKREDKTAEIHEREAEEQKYLKTLKLIVGNTSEKLIFDYPQTIQLLKERSNPKYFLNDNRKTIIATQIYSTLISIGDHFDKRQIRLLRIKANEELGINLPSEHAYEVLTRVFNPLNYVDDNFDSEKLLACNWAHRYIENNKHNLRKLEQFANKIGFLIL